MSGPEGPGHQGLGHRGVVHQGLGRGPLERGQPGWGRRWRTSYKLTRSEVVTAHIAHWVSTERDPAVLCYVVQTDGPVRGRHRSPPCSGRPKTETVSSSRL